MNRPTGDETLIEAALTSWRPRAPDGRILPHPAWADLDDAGRLALFDETLAARAIEAAFDPEGLTATGRIVLRAIRRAWDPDPG